jgi:MSHA pilin protein MshD
VELLIVIVVAGIALAALAAVVADTVRGSADAAVQTQGVMLAESYLEEALLKAYDNPDGLVGPCGATRDLWDSVLDYPCLSAAVVSDQQGNSLPGLAPYRVSVGVTDASIGGTSVRRVAVRITHLDGDVDLTLVGYRASL